MSQSWNWPAIRTAVSVLAHRQDLLIPRLCVRELREIDWEKLKELHGIRAVCFDKDNTLTVPYQLAIHFSVKEALGNCLRAFGQDSVAVFSNSLGCSAYDAPPEFALAKRFENESGLSVIRHSSRKPDGAGDVLRAFKRLTAKEIAFVGDRLLTDTVMANVAGFHSVHVRWPITVQGDNLPAALIRHLENAWLRTKLNLPD
jgi:phosphatidylglycerophosphatase GEP4